jgi:hypothetical protein
MSFSLHYLMVFLIISQLVISVAASSENSLRFSIRLPGKSYLMDWEEDDGDEELTSSKFGRFVGRGREYNVFDSPSRNFKRNYRGGSSGDNMSEDDFLERYRRFHRPSYTQNPRKRNSPVIVQKVQNWWATSISPKLESMPKIVCRVEPTTTLKLRKTFRPLKTIVRVGADFNTQLGVWQFKSSWEEPIIGGKLTLIGNELHVTKSWRLYVGKKDTIVY